MKNNILIRSATEKDVPAILSLIKELADYEKLSEQVIATEDELKKVLFDENDFVEVLVAEYGEQIIGQALFFKNFSTFLSNFSQIFINCREMSFLFNFY